MAMKLRPPGTDILVPRKRGLDEAWKSFIMLGIALMFYVAMMGPWGWLKAIRAREPDSPICPC